MREWCLLHEQRHGVRNGAFGGPYLHASGSGFYRELRTKAAAARIHCMEYFLFQMGRELKMNNKPIALVFQT